MEKFIVRGEVRLNGTIRVGGAKNAILPIMAATLLSSGISIIHDIPYLRDIKVMEDILSLLGAKITRENHSLIIDTSNIQEIEIPEHLMREMRASVFLMGALLGKFLVYYWYQ